MREYTRYAQANYAHRGEALTPCHRTTVALPLAHGTLLEGVVGRELQGSAAPGGGRTWSEGGFRASDVMGIQHVSRPEVAGGTCLDV